MVRRLERIRRKTLPRAVARHCNRDSHLTEGRVSAASPSNWNLGGIFGVQFQVANSELRLRGQLTGKRQIGSS